MQFKKIYILAVLVLIGIIFTIWKLNSNSKKYEKGFPTSTYTLENENKRNTLGINSDSIKIKTQPSEVIQTGISNIRLATIYKVNTNKDNNLTFTGTNSFLYFQNEEVKGNNWNGNLMPGFSGVNGYNMVNVNHFNLQTNAKKNLFNKPVLIKNLFYPALYNDTLNFKVVKRNHILVSAYNEDTNKDNFINQKDLRRFFVFDSNGENQKILFPNNASAFKSEYDSQNDLMYVFTRIDKNMNGQIEDFEPIHIYWVNLTDPNKIGLFYE